MKRIGIIAALLPEAACLVKARLEPEVINPITGHIYLLVCGMGADRAHNAAQKMVANGCEALISWGTAGALAADIHPGAIILPETILASGDQTFFTAKNWRRAFVKELKDCPNDVYLGQLSDTLQVLTSSKDKFSARSQTDSLAVDMESAAIAEVARNEKLPFMAIRAISDSFNMSIPESALKFTNPYGKVQLSRLITALARRPFDIPKLIRLSLGFRAATKTLQWTGQRLIKYLEKSN